MTALAALNCSFDFVAIDTVLWILSFCCGFWYAVAKLRVRFCIFQRLCIFGLYGAIQMLLLLLLLQ